MQRLSALSTILLLVLFSSYSISSPVRQARQTILKTTYVYTAYSTLPATVTKTPIQNITCPTHPVSSEAGCPTGCTAVPCAGLLGIATDSFDCAVETPMPVWTSWEATSTCGSGSAVHEFTEWGGHAVERCRATESASAGGVAKV